LSGKDSPLLLNIYCRSRFAVPYTDHFRLVDDVSGHFDTAVAAVDPMIKSRYAGFYAVASAAVLELALKEIIIAFAQSKHPLFGSYVADRYERINGRIKMDNIKSEHLAPFGKTYRTRFDRLVKRVDRFSIYQRKGPVITAYENLLTCRHTFAHEGMVPPSTTYDEVKHGFEAGKTIMKCLAKCLA
jgi:hypothetical protein